MLDNVCEVYYWMSNVCFSEINWVQFQGDYYYGGAHMHSQFTIILL